MNVAGTAMAEEAAPARPTRRRPIEPYTQQSHLVADRLRTIRLRVRAAIEQMQFASQHEGEEQKWPSDLLAAEKDVDARVEATRDRESFPVLRVRDRFGLSVSEELVLWLLIANELCPITRRLVRALATEESVDPTTDAIRRIVYGETHDARCWRELAEQGPLRRYSFIERADTRAELPEHRQTWKVARRVLALIHGDVGIDEQLLPHVDSERGPGKSLNELELSGDAACRIENSFERGGFIVLHGRVGQGRCSALTAAATARGLRVVTVRTRSLSKDREVTQKQLRIIARECRLLDLVPLFCDLDALGGNPEGPDRLDLFDHELTGLVLATSTRPISRRWKRAPISIELAPISGAQRAALWSRALPMATEADTEVLATMYPLAPALIEATARAAIEESAGASMRPEHITEGLRSVLDDRLAGLATRVHVTQTWDDLVLPDDQLTAIVELLARIRERRRVYEDWGFAEKVGKGLGVSALFSGPPGTGKTMAAGLIARTLSAELYQVDLSKIVSKWIGETEKNLACLFDAAEAGHAILLFDEADALFGKRTEIRSSNDRYANQEVNFLLQRLESYAGICILTTNHETAIDEAFRRRLSVHVRLPMPEVEERRKLWAAMIPAKAPTSGELRLDDLADKFVMSGGYIKNAVLRAAFLAADEQGRIDAARLSRAAQLEYEAMGKLVGSHSL